jgi:gliding motility-associated-like protein
MKSLIATFVLISLYSAVGAQSSIQVTAHATASSCESYYNSEVFIIASGGTPPYSYALDGSDWSNSQVFLSKGGGPEHTVLVKDATGQTASQSFTINNYYSPPALSVKSVSNPTGCTAQDGSVTLQATGGAPPYTYSQDKVSWTANATFSGLPAGLYYFYVKDYNGCTAEVQYNNVSPCGGFGFSNVNASCGQNGEIHMKAYPNANNPPITYSLDGVHYQGTGDFTGLTPGMYIVHVKDGAGVYLVGYYIISDCNLSVQGTPQDATCGNNDGRITVSGANGTPPYMYTIDGFHVQYQYQPVFINLAPGNYNVVVIDARGKMAGTVVSVGNGCPHATAMVTNATCGNGDGSITVAGSGGTLPYSYSIDRINYQTSNVFAGLPPGPYTIRMKDASPSPFTATVSATVGACLQLGSTPQSSTCAGKDGQITAAGSGGVQPYTYSLDGIKYQSDNVFAGLSADNYTLTIKDANSNKTSTTVVVSLNNTLTVDAGPSLSICEGKSAVIQARSNGKSFSWRPSTGLTDATLLQPTASPQVTTLYTLTATDGVCKQTTSINVIVDPAPTADAGKDNTICYGKPAQLHGSGGNTFVWNPITYLNDPTVADPTVDMPSGSMTWNLTVTDAKGCQSLNKASVTMAVTPPAKLFAGTDTSVLAGQPVPLDAQDVNNSGFTKFTWSPGEGLSNAAIQDPVAILQEGDITYNVTASTDAGCTATGSITIKTFKVSDIFVPAAFSPNGDGHNDVLKAIPMGIREFKYFAVFSRWGQRIFYTSDPSAGWDGIINGTIQEAGTYVWMTGGIDYQGHWIQRKGTVMLIR